MASGFGRRLASPRMRRAHYALVRWFVAGVHRTMTRLMRAEVRITDSAEAERALSSRRGPVIVLSRHAGEGDSLLVLHELLVRHRRRPRVVLHEALRLEPLIDILGHRLPNRFVDPRGGDTEGEIAAMAADLGDEDALLIFPEGGNFSPSRRRRAIERLRRAGHAEEAGWASAMRHVSAPRPGGALAAIAAAPHADVVFIGHAGAPVGIRELWRGDGDRPDASRCACGSPAPARSRPGTTSGSTGSSAGGGRSTRGSTSGARPERAAIQAAGAVTSFAFSAVEHGADRREAHALKRAEDERRDADGAHGAVGGGRRVDRRAAVAEIGGDRRAGQPAGAGIGVG